MSSYEYEQISSSPKIPEKVIDKPLLDLTQASAILINGQPKSGKTKMVDWYVWKFWQHYVLVFWMYSAKGYENLYTVINKDCKRRWKDQVEKNPDLKDRLPACQCNKAIPSLWLVPNYFDVDNKSLAYSNGDYWRSVEEFKKYHFEVTKEDIEMIANRELKKPESLRKKPLLKVMKFTPPVDASSTETYKKELYDAIVIGKTEHRVLLQTPSTYTSDHIGKLEEYGTVATNLDYIHEELPSTDIMKRIHPKSIDDKLSARERNNAKIAVVMTELKNVAPNPKLNPDKEAILSKRSLYKFIPEKRHGLLKWIVADCQTATDIFDGVRLQFTDQKIFKRTTIGMAGTENEKFYKYIDTLCNNIYMTWGFKPNNVPTMAKLRLLEQYNLCRISELPDNRALMKLESDEFIIKKVKHASFHHQDDSKDNFFDITGIKFKKLRKEQPKATATPSKRASTKKVKEGVMLRIQQYVKEGLKFADIVTKLGELEKDETIPNLGYGSIKPKSLNQQYNRWLSKQA